MKSILRIIPWKLCLLVNCCVVRCVWHWRKKNTYAHYIFESMDMHRYEWMIQREGIIQADKITWTKQFTWFVEMMVWHYDEKNFNVLWRFRVRFDVFINIIIDAIDSIGLTGEIQLKPGIYNYTFQCMMPSDLPSSVEGSIGYIRYTACVVVDVPMWRNKEFELQFSVIRAIDLNEYPSLRVKSFHTYSCSYIFIFQIFIHRSLIITFVL